MTSFWLFIKHHFSWIWRLIENVNARFFALRYGDIKVYASGVLEELSTKDIIFSLVKMEDIEELSNFLKSQPQQYVKNFQPHDFDVKTLERLLKNMAFVMMKAKDFTSEKFLGYFFLRCFCIGKAFHGFIVDNGEKKRGIGTKMMSINMAICQKKNLRLFSTVSKENMASIVASNKACEILSKKALKNDYLLIEWGPKAI